MSFPVKSSEEMLIDIHPFEERPDTSHCSLVPKLNRHPDELGYERIFFFYLSAYPGKCSEGDCQTATSRK